MRLRAEPLAEIHGRRSRSPFADELVSSDEAGVPVSGTMPRILQMRITRRFDYQSAEPLILQGECLRPWFMENDVVWYDRTLAPSDRDTVVCLATYGTQVDGARRFVELLSVKQFREVGGEKYLTCADGFLEASSVTILGPVTAWHRPGWWRRPAVRKMDFDLPVRVIS